MGNQHPKIMRQLSAEQRNTIALRLCNIQWGTVITFCQDQGGLSLEQLQAQIHPGAPNMALIVAFIDSLAEREFKVSTFVEILCHPGIGALALADEIRRFTVERTSHNYTALPMPIPPPSNADRMCVAWLSLPPQPQYIYPLMLESGLAGLSQNRNTSSTASAIIWLFAFAVLVVLTAIMCLLFKYQH